jgi:hypothetical protein
VFRPSLIDRGHGMSQGVLARCIARPALAVVATFVALGFVVNGSLKPVVGIESRPDRSDRTRDRSGESTLRRSTTPIVVPVRKGRAHVELVTRDPGSRSLVIVSALSRQPGPHVFHVAVQPVAANSAAVAENEEAGSDDSASKKTGRSTVEKPRKSIEPEPSNNIQTSDATSHAPIPQAEIDPVVFDPPRDRTFYILDRDGDVSSAGNYATVRAELKALGKSVQIYVDSHDVFGVAEPLLKDLISTFDRRIIPEAKRRLGEVCDIDGDGRFTVLLSSRLGRLADGRYKIDGFVRAADFDRSLSPPFSNHADMLYLNADLKPGPHLRTIVIHEYMHALAVSWRNRSGSNRPDRADEEGWLDEGLAHLAEDEFGFSRTNLDYRVSAFLSRPEAYRLVVADYYAAELFRSHGTRGAAYLFLRYCADRFGADLALNLMRSPLRGIANIEAATGRRFADLYRDWTVAMATGFDQAKRSWDVTPSEFHAASDQKLREPVEEQAKSSRAQTAAAEQNPASADRERIERHETISMKTFGEFGRKNLAGPRSTRLEPDFVDRRLAEFALESTTSKFIEIAGSRAGGVRIDVDCPSGSEPQVTLIRLPEERADLAMTIESIAGAESAEPSIQIVIRERSGVGVRLTSLSWETLDPPQVVDPLSAPTRLDSAAIASIFGSDRVEKAGELIGKRAISLKGLADRDGAIVIKLTGIDDSGRSVAAWAEIARRRAPSDDLIKTDLESKPEPKP